MLVKSVEGGRQNLVALEIALLVFADELFLVPVISCRARIDISPHPESCISSCAPFLSQAKQKEDRKIKDWSTDRAGERPGKDRHKVVSSQKEE